MENPTIVKAESSRGKVVLLMGSFKFHFDRTLASEESRWRCRVPKCTAAIYTVGEELIVSKHNLNHCHDEPCNSTIQKAALVAALKRKATEDIGLTPKRLVHTVLKNTAFDALNVDDIKNVKRAVYRERRKKFPKLPRCQREVHELLHSMRGQIVSTRQEDFLLANDMDANIIIFSCNTNLRHLCLSDRIFMDGTFKYCPQYFFQLFTIHGHLNGHYIPLVFCLLKNKCADTYRKCLTTVRERCAEINLDFQPAEVVIDFEIAIHNAITTVWDEAKIIGCRFHLTQAWWRKIQQLGLTKDYRERTDAGKWLGYCFGLKFLGNGQNDIIFIIQGFLFNRIHDMLSLLVRLLFG